MTKLVCHITNKNHSVFGTASAVTEDHVLQQESLKINREILISKACLLGLTPNDF